MFKKEIVLIKVLKTLSIKLSQDEDSYGCHV